MIYLIMLVIVVFQSLVNYNKLQDYKIDETCLLVKIIEKKRVKKKIYYKHGLNIIHI
jgi:hypothetical protein